MKHIIAFLAMVVLVVNVSAQCSLVAKVIDKESGEPLVAATVFVTGQNKGALTDLDGIARIEGLSCEQVQVAVRYVGYSHDTMMVNLPATDTLHIELQSMMIELSGISIVSTRSSRSIQNIPTRVEFVSEEELDEKTNMRSGDITMILSESTGIEVQPTSATSGNSSIRIQGLDGRYTQMLKDGFPVFSGAASGLGLLQTPPLDLKQVEIVKGSSSTLYGGGAIAGMVNLISKTPNETPERMLHLDATHTRGINANAWFSHKIGKIGYTLLTSYNHNGAYAPADEIFSAIPHFDRVVFNPKVFTWFNPKTQLAVGLNTMWEKRQGGDMDYLKGDETTGLYFENNHTKRLSTTADFTHNFNRSNKLQAKASWSYYDRTIELADYYFEGTQRSLFSEINYLHATRRTECIVGVNLLDDIFDEVSHTTLPARNSDLLTLGTFLQNNTALNDRFEFEAGVRYDYVNNYGSALLPRLSLLYKITDRLTSRLGGGMGYKAPTIFTEETEIIHYRNVNALTADNHLETSYGCNWDLNYSTTLFDDKLSLSVNHLFFYTYIEHPLLMKPNTSGYYEMHNIDGHIDTRGIETNVKLGYEDLHLFLGYTFNDAETFENGIHSDAPLTSKHRINAILMYEDDEHWRIGLESYYFSRQTLCDGTEGSSYVTFGMMVEHFWKHVSIYANFENFSDRRQSRYGALYTGTRSNPQFADLYMPIEGFVFSLGAKIRW